MTISLERHSSLLLDKRKQLLLITYRNYNMKQTDEKLHFTIFTKNLLKIGIFKIQISKSIQVTTINEFYDFIIVLNFVSHLICFRYHEFNLCLKIKRI